MTLEEERLRYEAALDLTRTALTHIHKVFKMEEKLLHVVLAGTAMGAAIQMVDNTVSKELLVAQPEWAAIMQQAQAWEEKLKRLRAVPPDGGGQILPVNFTPIPPTAP